MVGFTSFLIHLYLTDSDIFRTDSLLLIESQRAEALLSKHGDSKPQGNLFLKNYIEAREHRRKVIQSIDDEIKKNKDKDTPQNK